MKNFPDIPPVWTFGSFVLSWVLAKAVPVLAFPVYGVQLLGLAWIGLAVLLILWSALYFRTHKTTIEPHHVPTALIVKGPYRVTRNPIYLALVIAALGFGLWCGAVSALIPAVLLAFVLHRRFVLPEEAGLIAAFGEDAEAYIAKTKRWV